MEYGLIAESLKHSYSKEIHELFGFYTYELKEIEPSNLEAFMKAKDFKGINVTIPYKEAVIPFLDEIDPVANEIGAVNTVVNRGGKLYGFNTDFFGMSELIKKTGMDLKGAKVLILGTGGTSKTAAYTAKHFGAETIIKVSRKPGKECITYEEAVLSHSNADFIINTTPVGMYPKEDGMPIDLSAFSGLKGVIDAIYNPLNTKLVLSAKDRGINATGGLYMLVMQAVGALSKFMNAEVSSEKALEIYHKILFSKGNLILTGMPGSGKSTVGKLIAERFSLDFIDTDEEIVRREGREIKDIFETDGEAYFRNAESDVILSLSKEKNKLISTGGGAVLRSCNVENLRKNGTVVFLDRDPSEITPTNDRPLADNGDKVMRLYRERLPIYKKNKDIEVTVKKSPEAVADEIGRIIDAY
ncbi:MAG: shikimate dehydrogenase [Lachnospiraceae bacterium]|nr:shikimate dehydrogenase [Lachnospiraceae bacterium]